LSSLDPIDRVSLGRFSFACGAESAAFRDSQATRVGSGGIGRRFCPTYNMGMNYRDIITMEPGKRGGKPCIRGLRIAVQDVLEYLASGMTEQEIIADFPDLTAIDIRACLAFAADRERRLMAPQ
jgi:uncharacterized protein (DUF433 family)